MGFFGWGKKGKAPDDDADLARRALAEKLREAADRGQPVAADDLRALCRGTGDDEPGAHLGTAGFVTCDRVDSLRRAVESFVSSSTSEARPCEVVVMDDSRDPAARERTRAMLRPVATPPGTTIRYAGADEKHRWADDLARLLRKDLGDGAPALLEACLFDPHDLKRTVAANRNALLLDAAGEPLTMMDDDVVCRVTRTPDPQEGLALCRVPDATELWFFPDRAAALGAGDLRERDLRVEHQRVLGRPLRACVDVVAKDAPLELAGLSDELFRALCQGDGRVLVSSTGYAGDSGMGAPSYFAFLVGDSFDRLAKDPEAYATNRLTRAVIRAARRTTISDGAMVMGGGLALDNRALLPPFPPAPRGQDGSFGVLLRRCHPKGYIAQLPWALEHDPPTARAFTEDALLSATSKFGLSDILLGEIKAGAPVASVEAPEKRTRQIGRHLEHVGKMKPGDFAELVHDGIRRKHGAQVTFFEQLLDARGGHPDHWVRDAERMLGSARASVASAGIFAPPDLDGDAPQAAMLDRARGIVGSYGAVLVAWPEIVAAARGLREAGTRLSQPV